MNGVYALLEGGFEGMPAYEKADGSVGRVMFYSRRRQRWKVADSIDDNAGNFASAKSTDAGPPGPSLTWTVFEGKELGLKEDLAVLCDSI